MKNASSPSPVTDGKRVFFLYGSGQLFAYTLDGRALWKRDLPDEHGRLNFSFPYSSSPLLIDGKLIVTVIQAPPRGAHPLDPSSYLLGLDPETGKDLWKRYRWTDTSGENTQSYATPCPLRTAAGVQIVVPGGDYLTAHDPSTGKEIWRSDSYNPRGHDRFRTVASAVVLEQVAFVCAARGSSMFAIDAAGRGRLSPAGRLWTVKYPSSDVCTPLVYHGRLFVLDGERRVMTCLEPRTARVIWQKKIGGEDAYYASPVASESKIYCFNLSGEVVVLWAGDRFQVLNRVSMGQRSNGSSIAIAQGQLFIRTSRKLFCLEKGR
jgi:outer membrane protein assembly factor BamB